MFEFFWDYIFVIVIILKFIYYVGNFNVLVIKILSCVGVVSNLVISGS